MLAEIKGICTQCQFRKIRVRDQLVPRLNDAIPCNTCKRGQTEFIKGNPK